MFKIGRVVREKVGVQINLQTLVLHLSSYYVYLVSFLAYYSEVLFFILAPPDKLTPNILFWLDLFRLVTSTIS